MPHWRLNGDKLLTSDKQACDVLGLGHCQRLPRTEEGIGEAPNLTKLSPPASRLLTCIMLVSNTSATSRRDRHRGDLPGQYGMAKALGFTDPHKALKDHCKSLIKLNSGETSELGLGLKPKGIILLTEPDLYRLIMRSKLPSAEKVQDWVCEEVLPSIRQTGKKLKHVHQDIWNMLSQ